MGKIAFVFSGQGDQFPGMGRELYESSPDAATVFEACEALRPGTMEQCFRGPAEALKQTKNTQPCLFAMELAAAAAVKAAGICPDAAAGFSLGEVSAAAAAGLFDLETGFRMVCERGRLMQRDAEKQETAMAAVVKLPGETVEALCKQFGMYPVNYNCPGQISVSGLSENLPAFSQAVKEAGGRALPLKVRGAFHSPFMKEASEGFKEALKTADFRAPRIPLYSNFTALPYSEDAAALLAKQIVSPVRWEALIRNMIADGADVFVEIGPGKTLTNMIRKIDGKVKTYCIAELSTLISEVEPC